MKHDYIYFCHDNQGNNVPLATGSTSDLQLVLWLNRQEKETIIPKKWASKELFVRVNEENFIVQNRS